MPNTVEYKDWLFVVIPEGADWFEFNDPKEGEIVYQNNGNDDMILKIPPGSYQIIGKGDALGETDWHIMIDVIDGDEGFYPNFDHTNFREVTAIQSGHSLLRSLGMEPGTTLILKKN